MRSKLRPLVIACCCLLLASCQGRPPALAESTPSAEAAAPEDSLAPAPLAPPAPPGLTEVGYVDRYDTLPALVFEATTQQVFDGLPRAEGAAPTPSPGRIALHDRSLALHGRPRHGPANGSQWTEWVGSFPGQHLQVVTHCAVSEHIGFGTVALVDSLSRHEYQIVSIGDGPVVGPFASPGWRYLVYWDNDIYKDHHCSIGVLRVDHGAKPDGFLKEHRFGRSETFAVDEIRWNGDEEIVVSGYVDTYDRKFMHRSYQYYRASLRP